MKAKRSRQASGADAANVPPGVEPPTAPPGTPGASNVSAPLDDIPTLTDVVMSGDAGLSSEALGELQAELSARVLKLAEELTHGAAREMQALLLERVCDRLRAELPRLIDEAFRARLK